MPWIFKANLRGPAGLVANSVPVAATVNLNTITAPNIYSMIAGPADYVAQNWPANTRLSMFVTNVGNEAVQMAYEYRGTQRLWQRSSTASKTSWLGWREIGKEWVSSLGVGDDLDQVLTPGQFQQPGTPTDWKAQHYPVNTPGSLDYRPIATAAVQVFTTFEPVPRTFKRWRNASMWGKWHADALPDTPPSTGSGLKVVPLQLTLGTASSGNMDRFQTTRIPMDYAAPILRGRFHIRNSNATDGIGVAGAIPFTGIWLGKHDTANKGSFLGTPTKIVNAFSTPADGSEYITPWVNISNTSKVEDLLSFGYNSSVSVRAGSGFSYMSTNDTLAGTAGVVPMTEQSITPFFIWFEAETYASTPTAAVLGDSLSCGAVPRVGSVISKYCYERGALPIHYANSGDKMDSWFNAGHPKWDYYTGLCRPDALIIAIGSNDIFGGYSLATMQAMLLSVAAMAATRITPNIYLSTITPRTIPTGAPETVRRDYNTYLLTLPGNARGVFDFVSPISSDDETILPAYDADGVHMTDAGYDLQAAQIRPHITSPALMYAT